MRTLLEAQGFEVLRLTTAPKTFSLSYYVSRLGGYARSASAAVERATQALNLADRPVTPDFRDRMLVVARPR
jgi:hypothetical protein